MQLQHYDFEVLYLLHFFFSNVKVTCKTASVSAPQLNCCNMMTGIFQCTTNRRELMDSSACLY